MSRDIQLSAMSPNRTVRSARVSAPKSLMQGGAQSVELVGSHFRDVQETAE